MADEIDVALDECEAARAGAALPLIFADDAVAEARQRSEAQFRASFPLVRGGWPVLREGVLRASTLFGQVAKALALFHDPKAQEISVDEMASARVVVQRECRLRLAQKKGKPPEAIGAEDGLVCGG